METLAVNVLDPASLIATFGLIGVLAIIFAETGLLVGFFFPGDSLLFIAGVAASPFAGKIVEGVQLNIAVLLAGAPICAIAGAQLGHLLGARYGRRMFERPNSRLFKDTHVAKAEYYFGKFGPAKAVILARFIPIVRTFLNPVAGMLGMNGRRFLLWNVIGGVAWVEAMLLFGRFVGSKVDNIDRYILPGVFVVVLISLVPIVIEVIKSRRNGEAAGPVPVPEPTGKHHRRS